MSWFKVDTSEVLCVGLTNSEIGMYIRYKALCEHFKQEALTWKQVCFNFTPKERKFITSYFKIEPELNQSTTEVEPELNQSKSKVSPKSDNKNKDIACARVYNRQDRQDRQDIFKSSDKSSDLNVDEPVFDIEKINHVLDKYCLPHIKKLTDERKRKLRQRVRDAGSFEEFLGQLEAALAESSFLRGDSGKWQADFDFFLQASKWQKAIEGAYADKDDDDSGYVPGQVLAMFG